MTAVAAQPTIFCGIGSLSVPVSFGFAVISIMTNMIGTAATPLITALQNSALIGLIEVKSNATPNNVATHKVA